MSDNAPTEIEGAEFAGQLLFRLWRACHTHTAAALATIGLTPPLFAVLNYLRDRNGAIQQRIASAMRVDPSTMVALIDELEAAGLAERRLHAADRRAREIVLTPKGRRTLKRARELAEEAEAEVLRGLSASERDTMTALLRKATATAPPPPLWSGEESA